MEAFLSSSATLVSTISPAAFWSKSLQNPCLSSSLFSFCFPHKTSFHSHNFSNLSLSFSFSNSSCASSSVRTSVSVSSSPSITSTCKIPQQRRHWMVLMESPPQELDSKPEIIDYYVRTLQNVLGSEQDAQMSIYDASCTTSFGFCCFIVPDAARDLARLPSVVEVKPDADLNSSKDYSSNSNSTSFLLFPAGTTKRWRVQVYKPPARIVTKAQVVDYYVQILTEVLGNEQDAQMCICDISWQSSYEFCCELDDKCAQDLTGVYGVLSVHPDQNRESEKILTDDTLQDPSSPNQVIHVKTKKIFITGLSFYTSEKTLREAFEGFGEIVAVNIIMDKISKRSKGYGFIEYTTEEAASLALKEMNGKIINGWMITVDVAKKNPIKYSRGRPVPE